LYNIISSHEEKDPRKSRTTYLPSGRRANSVVPRLKPRVRLEQKLREQQTQQEQSTNPHYKRRRDSFSNTRGRIQSARYSSSHQHQRSGQRSARNHSTSSTRKVRKTTNGTRDYHLNLPSSRDVHPHVWAKARVRAAKARSKIGTRAFMDKTLRPCHFDPDEKEKEEEHHDTYDPQPSHHGVLLESHWKCQSTAGTSAFLAPGRKPLHQITGTNSELGPGVYKTLAAEMACWKDVQYIHHMFHAPRHQRHNPNLAH